MHAFLRKSTLLLSFALAACAQAPQAPESPPPVVFVHGNGDTAALWTTMIWRFESNGWERRLLHAVDLRYPLARSVDAKPQPLRTSTTEAMQQLAAEVDEVLKRTGRSKVALVGNSRGGLVIRNYLQNGGGAAKVSHAVLGGTPNHGITDWEETRGNEFNAKSPFMLALNAIPNEVVPGVKTLTLRSDRNDKYAHPDGRFMGKPGRPTNVGYDGPALKGAENVVLPGADHREVSYGKQAFAETWRFLAGRPATLLDIVAEDEVVLDGKVNGMEGSTQTNLPVAGANLEVYSVDCASGERQGAAALVKTTGADGRWGPLRTHRAACHEFVLAVKGRAITHTYRSPFPRSSSIVHLRPGALAPAERDAGSVVTITRPRGYFGHGRDVFTLDGKVPPGINEGVPGVSAGKLLLDAGPLRAVPARFNDEHIVVRNWPASENRVVFAEFHY